MKIGILGAGTWGIALARMLVNHGHSVILWSAIGQEIDYLKEAGKHPNLRDMIIPLELKFTKSIEKVCNNDIVVFAVPSIYIRSTIRSSITFINPHSIIVDVAKGIEKDSLYTMSEIIREELQAHGLNNSVVVLSGPTHAEEVAKDMPTAIISTSLDGIAAETVQKAFNNEFFRVYTNKDIKGIELCGALKNVIALATGIATGLGYGDNARAALITRGMAEITRLGYAMGCNKETFYGLAGIGDLIVTATSQHSRNNRAGQLIGKGKPVELVKQEIGMVVEGLNTLPAAVQLAEKYNIDMPIVHTVKDIIDGVIKPDDAVYSLMNRETKEEKPY